MSQSPRCAACVGRSATSAASDESCSTLPIAASMPLLSYVTPAPATPTRPVSHERRLLTRRHVALNLPQATAHAYSPPACSLAPPLLLLSCSSSPPSLLLLLSCSSSTPVDLAQKGQHTFRFLATPCMCTYVKPRGKVQRGEPSSLSSLQQALQQALQQEDFPSKHVARCKVARRTFEGHGERFDQQRVQRVAKHLPPKASAISSPLRS